MLQMTYGIPEPDDSVYYTETGKFIMRNPYRYRKFFDVMV